MQDEYLARDVQAIARISKSTLKNWVDVKAIKPIKNRTGRGTKRKFSKENLLDVMVCRELSFIQVKPRYFRSILDSIADEGAWKKIANDPLRVYFLILSYPRAINSKTGLITSVSTWATLVTADNAEELGKAVASYHTTTTINLTQLYKDSNSL